MKLPRRQFTSLAEWRRTLGYTQKQAANVLRVSQGCYCKWENHAPTSRTKARHVAERTGVPLEVLLRIA